MADPLTAYRWCDYTLAQLKGVLGEAVDRLRDSPTDATVREQENEFLARTLEDQIRMIEDCLCQARDEAFDIRNTFPEFSSDPAVRKRAAVPINKRKQQAG